MSINRLLPSEAEIMCLCGQTTRHATGALRVGIGVILTPLCGHCKVRRAEIFVQSGEPTGYPDETLARIRAVKAVFKWLVDAGSFVDGVTAEMIPPALMQGATAWPTVGEVVVPLSSAFAQAATAKAAAV